MTGQKKNIKISDLDELQSLQDGIYNWIEKHPQYQCYEIVGILELTKQEIMLSSRETDEE